MFTIIKKTCLIVRIPILTSVNYQQQFGTVNTITFRWDYFIDHVSELIERAERIEEDYEKNDSYIPHLGFNK